MTIEKIHRVSCDAGNGDPIDIYIDTWEEYNADTDENEECKFVFVDELRLTAESARSMADSLICYAAQLEAETKETTT